MGPRTFRIDCGLSEANFEATMNALPNIVRGVTVTRTPYGGPGLIWTVTFLDYGARDSLTLVSTSLVDESGAAGVPTVSITRLYTVRSSNAPWYQHPFLK